MELRRLTAKKVLVWEIISGKFVQKTGLESPYIITPTGRKVSRVRILGNVVDKYINPSGTYGFLVIDDGTGSIRVKFFENISKVEKIEKGSLVDIIGRIRCDENEIWINVEIAKVIEDPNFETLRILEIVNILKEQCEKIRNIMKYLPQSSDMNELYTLLNGNISKKEIEAILEAKEIIYKHVEENKVEEDEKESKVLKLIKELDRGEGADYFELLKTSGLEENKLDEIIDRLLETGKCFEPKPGKLRVVI